MESNNFNEFVNVLWQALQALHLPLEALVLITLGMIAVFVMRRYKSSLAAARTLRPEAAISLQQVVLPKVLPSRLRSPGVPPQPAAPHAPAIATGRPSTSKHSPAHAVA